MTISRCVLLAACFACALSGAAALAQPPTSSDPNQPPRPAPSLTLPNRPAKPAKPPAPPLLSPLDPKLDVKAALEAAKREADSKGGRIVIFWAADPDAMSTQAFVEAIRTEDVRKLLGLEFAVVWAETGKSEHAADNRALAKTLGATISASDPHATVTVLDAAGKPLATRSASEMLDEVRKGMYSVLKIEDFLIPLKAPTPEAKALMDAALAKAKPAGKGVLLVFGEFGNQWTAKFRGWLAQPEVERALSASTVVAHIELQRDKGAFELIESHGGTHVQSLPWYSMLDAAGKVVATSQPEKTPNIGFPTDDGEITAFLALLRKGSPALSEADAKALQASLVAYRERKAP